MTNPKSENPSSSNYLEEFDFTELESKELLSIDPKPLTGLVSLRFAMFTLKDKALEDEMFKRALDPNKQKDFLNLCTEEGHPDFPFYFNQAKKHLSHEFLTKTKEIRSEKVKPWTPN